MYLLTAVGITVGFHRLLTHRSFQTSKPLEYAFAVLGSMAVQGPVDLLGRRPPQAPRPHRRRGRPPQPPRRPRRRAARRARRPLARPRRLADVDPGPGRLEALRPGPLRGPRDAGDRPRTSSARRSLSLALPALAGYLVSGTLAGAATGLLWGGLVRIFFVHHVTWSVNSCVTSSAAGASTPTTTRPTSSGLPSLARGVLAPQPSCVPALGLARPAARRARPLGGDHRDDGEARPGPERGPNLDRSARLRESPEFRLLAHPHGPV